MINVMLMIQCDLKKNKSKTYLNYKIHKPIVLLQIPLISKYIVVAMKFKISTCYLYLLHVLDYVRFRSGVDVNVSVIGYYCLSSLFAK